jgi:hypothetical protein
VEQAARYAVYLLYYRQLGTQFCLLFAYCCDALVVDAGGERWMRVASGATGS